MLPGRPWMRHAAVTPSREGEGGTAACSGEVGERRVTVRDRSEAPRNDNGPRSPWRDGDQGPGRRGFLGADGLLDVEREQQLAVQLVGAADQVAGLTFQRVRRCLEVA